MWTRLKSYLQESYQEFRRVNWPTKNETIRLTVVVVLFSLAVAIFLGILDFLFTYLLEKFVI